MGDQLPPRGGGRLPHVRSVAAFSDSLTDDPFQAPSPVDSAPARSATPTRRMFPDLPTAYGNIRSGQSHNLEQPGPITRQPDLLQDPNSIEMQPMASLRSRHIPLDRPSLPSPSLRRPEAAVIRGPEEIYHTPLQDLDLDSPLDKSSLSSTRPPKIALSVNTLSTPSESRTFLGGFSVKKMFGKSTKLPTNTNFEAPLRRESNSIGSTQYGNVVTVEANVRGHRNIAETNSQTRHFGLSFENHSTQAAESQYSGHGPNNSRRHQDLNRDDRTSMGEGSTVERIVRHYQDAGMRQDGEAILRMESSGDIDLSQIAYPGDGTISSPIRYNPEVFGYPRDEPQTVSPPLGRHRRNTARLLSGQAPMIPLPDLPITRVPAVITTTSSDIRPSSSYGNTRVLLDMTSDIPRLDNNRYDNLRRSIDIDTPPVPPRNPNRLTLATEHIEDARERYERERNVSRELRRHSRVQSGSEESFYSQDDGRPQTNSDTMESLGHFLDIIDRNGGRIPVDVESPEPDGFYDIASVPALWIAPGRGTRVRVPIDNRSGLISERNVQNEPIESAGVGTEDDNEWETVGGSAVAARDDGDFQTTPWASGGVVGVAGSSIADFTEEDFVSVDGELRAFSSRERILIHPASQEFHPTYHEREVEQGRVLLPNFQSNRLNGGFPVNSMRAQGYQSDSFNVQSPRASLRESHLFSSTPPESAQPMTSEQSSTPTDRDTVAHDIEGDNTHQARMRPSSDDWMKAFSGPGPVVVHAAPETRVLPNHANESYAPRQATQVSAATARNELLSRQYYPARFGNDGFQQGFNGGPGDGGSVYEDELVEEDSNFIEPRANDAAPVRTAAEKGKTPERVAGSLYEKIRINSMNSKARRKMAVNNQTTPTKPSKFPKTASMLLDEEIEMMTPPGAVYKPARWQSELAGYSNSKWGALYTKEQRKKMELRRDGLREQERSAIQEGSIDDSYRAFTDIELEPPKLFQRRGASAAEIAVERAKRLSLICLIVCSIFPPFFYLYGMGQFDWFIKTLSKNAISTMNHRHKRIALICGHITVASILIAGITCIVYFATTHNA